MKVKIVNKSGFGLPSYATALSAGMDLRAFTVAPMERRPLERVVGPSGIYLELPEGYEAQIRPRSGLASKHGITVANAPGPIDADYRGEIKVAIINLSKESFVLNPGERVAQMVVAKFERVEWEETDTLSDSERGAGGFGSTGRK